MPQFQFKPDQPPLGDLLRAVDRGSLQLPDFQRSWVWDDDRIRDLLSSVSQGWPVGAILLLECGGAMKFKARRFEGAPADGQAEERLVLDGQQRLTSLYLSLKSGKPVRTVNAKGDEIDRLYYFDIEKCLDSSGDRFEAILSIPASKQLRSDFNRKLDLDLSTPEAEYRNACIPATVAFDGHATRTWRRAFGEFHKHDLAKSELWDRFEQEVVDSIQTYRLPSIELSRDTSREAVCMVFEKVNTGGKPLDVFELVTASFAADQFDLREDWEARAKRLQERAILSDLGGTDFLQAVTLASLHARPARDDGRRYVGSKKGDVLDLTSADYLGLADKIEQGFQRAAQLLDRERVFDAKALPYQSQLIPLAAIIAAVGVKAIEEPARSKILQWYWCGVFGELYGGAIETRFGRDLQEVVAWIDGGPIPTTVRDSSFAPTRLLSMRTRGSAAYKGIMAQLLQVGARDFFQGDEIERSRYFADHVDIHHVFPMDWCRRENKRRDRADSVLNKTPLTARSNRRLGGVSPQTYLERIERGGIGSAQVDEILVTHLIDPAALRGDDFEAFLQHRARAILDRIEIATGKTIAGRDSEEVVKAFGAPLLTLRTVKPSIPPSNAVDRLFANYEILETLPAGGMSEGFKVRSQEGGIYFLKKVPVSGVPADALRRELDVYTKLQRAEATNVLQIYGFERDDTHLALVTEFADGGTLSHYVKTRGSLAPAEAKAICLQVLAGVRELHSIEIVHRDLKAENVLSAHGAWKLGDFGISKNLSRLVTQGRTFQGHGTPGFAPPEQMDGATAHPSADVYAIGKLLTFLVTGQTDVDQLMLPSWARLARRCTERLSDSRPSLDDVETELSQIAV
jgi:hypothetical protein